MAKLTDPWSCDLCGTKKQTTNRWFLGWIEPNSENEPIIHVMKWDEHLADSPKMTHICGLDCLAKWTLREAAKINEA